MNPSFEEALAACQIKTNSTFALRATTTQDMDAKFSPRVREVISLSREEALRLGHNYIGVEHLLLGIIKEGEGTAVRILEGLNCDLRNCANLWKVRCVRVRPNQVDQGTFPW